MSKSNAWTRASGAKRTRAVRATRARFLTRFPRWQGRPAPALAPPARDASTVGGLRSTWALPTSLARYGDDAGKTMALVVMNERGEYRHEKMELESILAECGLHGREFLDIESVRSTAITPTDRGIVVALSHIRAVVLPDKLFVFNPSRPVVADFLNGMSRYLATCHDIQARLKGNAAKDETTFSLIVLEGMLSAVARKYTRRVRCFEPVLGDMLQEVRSHASFTKVGSIHRLLPLRNSLSRFERSTESLLRVISGLLANDEAMAMLRSPRNKMSAEKWEKVVETSHVEVEVMLSSYHSRFAECLEASVVMRKQIISTLDVVEIALDKQRNNIMFLNLNLTVAAVSLAVPTWIGGMFGMNLTHGFEESHPAVFWGVFGGTVLAASLTYGVVMQRTMSKSSPKSRVVEDLHKLSDSLTQADVQDILLAYLEKNDLEHVNKDQFTKMMKQAAGHTLSPAEVDRIFRVFDSNGDEILSYRDIVNFICDQYGSS